MKEHSTDFTAIVLRRAGPLLVFVAAMWLVRVADTFRADGSSIAGVGIIPRTTGHMFGIVTAPLIHANWPHLLANTFPLVFLGSLLLLNGTREFMFVTPVCILSAGVGTWLFGAAGNHIGASGVVLGFMGYLLFRCVFDRKPSFLLITVLVAATYGTALLWSVIPRSGVSWSAHVFGFAGGILAAWLRPRSSGECRRPI